MNGTLVYSDFANLSDLPSYRQIDYWCRLGMLGEDRRNPGQGLGHYRHWTPDDVRRLRCVGAAQTALRKIGFYHVPADLAGTLWREFDIRNVATITADGVQVKVVAQYPRSDLPANLPHD